MSTDAGPERDALFLAEEVLRAIYGDDYQGCTTRPEHIARIIQKRLQRRDAHTKDLIELYEKVVEAAHLLSTPPEASKVANAAELPALLGERLDGIHAITTRTIETISRLRKDPDTDL